MGTLQIVPNEEEMLADHDTSAEESCLWLLIITAIII